jgi:hypothetical protein
LRDLEAFEAQEGSAHHEQRYHCPRNKALIASAAGTRIALLTTAPSPPPRRLLGLGPAPLTCRIESRGHRPARRRPLTATVVSVETSSSMVEMSSSRRGGRLRPWGCSSTRWRRW